MSTIPPDVSNEILNSWKEIARYLDRGVRTVQRWEAELNLPVRRPRSKGRSPVIALRSEIDLWLKTSMPGKQNGNGFGSFDFLRAESRELRLASQQLRSDVSRLRKELHLSVCTLVATLQRMADLHKGENGLMANHLINFPPPRVGRVRELPRA